jgi:hypothetical protein
VSADYWLEIRSRTTHYSKREGLRQSRLLRSKAKETLFKPKERERRKKCKWEGKARPSTPVWSRTLRLKQLTANLTQEI